MKPTVVRSREVQGRKGDRDRISGKATVAAANVLEGGGLELMQDEEDVTM